MIQIDEIGTLYANVPNDAPEGFQPDELPGWHVNATHKVPGWDDYRVTPSTPRRVFPGRTVFYTFADKAAFDVALEAADLTLPPPCHTSVTRRQAKQALLLAGLLPQVQPAIDAIADHTTKAMVQIEWDDSQTFERNRPALIALAAALGMDDEALDKLFITASKL